MTEGSSPQPPPGLRSQIAAGLAFCVLGSFAVIGGYPLDFGSLRRPGPGFFPLSLAALLIVAGLAVAVRAGLGVLAGQGEPWPDRAGAQRVVTMVAALAAMALLLDELGFLLCSALVTFVMMRYVGGRGRVESALFCVALSACLYLLFVRWLGVGLPAGSMFSR